MVLRRAAASASSALLTLSCLAPFPLFASNSTSISIEIYHDMSRLVEKRRFGSS